MRITDVESVADFLTNEVTRDWASCPEEREEWDKTITRYIESCRQKHAAHNHYGPALGHPWSGWSQENVWNDFEEWCGSL